MKQVEKFYRNKSLEENKTNNEFLKWIYLY